LVEGPAAGFYAGARLKVDGIELEDLAAPFGGRASLGTKAAGVNAIVGSPTISLRYGSWDGSSIPGPPASSRMTFLPRCMRSTARTMPAAPAPTMQMSAMALGSGCRGGGP
ncbi:MAG TPA: hypothetical protein VK608_15000, partial [Edaphobacter sp.]|nr:hypothetical protein [Edaphobacter sp.]